MRLTHRRKKPAHPADVLDRIALLLTTCRTSRKPAEIIPLGLAILRESLRPDVLLLLEYPDGISAASVLAWEGNATAGAQTPGSIRRTVNASDGSSILRIDGRSLEEWILAAVPGPRKIHRIDLNARNRPVGSLWVGRQAGIADFSAGDLRLAGLVADILAGTLLQSRLDNRVENQQARLQSIRSVERAITSSLDLTVILNVFLDQASAQLRADAASILLMDPRSREMTLAAARGFLKNNRPPSRIRVDHNLAAEAGLERKILSVESGQPDQPEYGHQPLMREEGFSAYYAAPLIAHGQVLGALEIFRRSPGEMEPEWLDLLEAFAMEGAIAIDNAETFHSLQRAQSEMSLLCDSAIESWSRAVDVRAREAEGHGPRVSELSVRTAEKMGVPSAQIQSVRRGALLHDIGKLGIPDEILWKRGSLSEAEWHVVRQHPKIAEQLLAPVDFLRSALDIPKFHHERWDGEGYPFGLSGTDIPLPARIFAVVDAWDSMQAHRPFRPAHSEAETIEHIRQSSGDRYDPDVVRSFFQVLGDRE
jgi:HD-GYP domain-containing protein (c-di-GMP phosphodiesterase class II)